MANTKKQKRKAESLYSQQRFEDSLEICNSIIETDKEAADVRVLKAENLFQLNRLEEASSELDQTEQQVLQKDLQKRFNTLRAAVLLEKSLNTYTGGDSGEVPANLEEARVGYKLVVEADTIEGIDPELKDDIMERRSFAKKQLIYLENPDSGDAKAAELLDKAFDTFQVEAMDGSGRQPGSKKEVEEVKVLMRKAREAQPKDAELLETISLYEDICEEAYERRFVGYKWLMILVGLVALYFLYAGISKLGTAGDVSPADAKNRMTNEIEQISEYMDRMEAAHDTVKEKNADFIEEREERMEELAGMDTEDYMKEITRQKRSRNWRNIRRGVFWSLMIVLYYFASRPPVFLINRRQRQMMFTSKSANAFKKVIVFLLGIFIAMPSFDRTVVVDSFGSVVGTYDEISPGLIIKIMGIVIVIVFVIWVAVMMLPILTIINYLRNYQYEKVDTYFEKATSTVKGWFGFQK